MIMDQNKNINIKEAPRINRWEDRETRLDHLIAEEERRRRAIRRRLEKEIKRLRALRHI